MSPFVLWAITAALALATLVYLVINARQLKHNLSVNAPQLARTSLPRFAWSAYRSSAGEFGLGTLNFCMWNARPSNDWLAYALLVFGVMMYVCGVKDSRQAQRMAQYTGS